MGIFGNTFGLPHLIIILVIILLLFGAPKLPGLARSVGQSMKIFRNEVKSDPKKDDEAPLVDDAPEAPAAKKTEL
jgi:sec-independent protein translocase protein TatA